MTSLAHIKAITIDAIDTLITPDPSIGAIYARSFHDKGFTFPPENIANFNKIFRKIYQELTAVRKLTPATERGDKLFWTQVFQKTLQVLIPDIHENTLKASTKHLWTELSKPENWKEIPGTRSPLELLTHAGYKIYIFSNADQRLQKILKGLGLLAFIEDIFLANDLGYRKPHPQSFAAVQDALGLEPSQILHIGNHPKIDIEGAQNAGWHTAYIKTLTKNILETNGEAKNNTLSINRLGDLTEILLKSSSVTA